MKSGVNGRKRRAFGSILERNGKFVIRLKRDGRDIWKSVGSDRRLAELALKKMEVALATEAALGVKKIAHISFEELWTVSEPLLRATHEPKTLAPERGRFKVILGYFKDRTVDTIDTAAVRDFLAYLRNARKLMPATANRYLSLISVLFKIAIERGCARENPARGIIRAKEEELEMQYLSADDLRGILSHAGDDAKPLLTLYAETGMRRSEALALAWLDIDFTRGCVIVRRSKTKRPREIPMTPLARQVLEALYAARAKDDAGDRPLVFPGIQGAAGERRASGVFKMAAKAAGFPALRLHDLRHALASGLVQAGVSLPEVGRILGDASPSVIMRYGRHAPKNSAVDAMAKLAAARAPKPEEPKPEEPKREEQREEEPKPDSGSGQP